MFAMNATKEEIREKFFLPSDSRATKLRDMFSKHVTYLDKSLNRAWKGPVEAVVPEEKAADMREAMNFIGAHVDKTESLPGGRVRLYSQGYYVHVGA
jgi:hypothetical protein